MTKTDDKIELEEEILEINAATRGRAPVFLPGKVASVFPALTHRNFQFYFAGQIVSLVGFWLQMVGQGFLVYQITGSEFWTGAVAAAGGLPTLFFTIFAGVLIDRVDKRKLLVFTQIAQLILALTLGFAVLFDMATIPMIMILAFLTGMVGAVDLPTRQSFVIEMVGKKDLASAISINVGTFNAARFVGPAMAGILIATVGVGWTFVLNGLTFIPITFFLTKIQPILANSQEKHLHPIESLKEGVKFVFTHEKLLYLTLLASVTAFFIWPYQTLMPAIAKTVFNLDSVGLGILLATAGLGSLAGAIYTSTQTAREERGKLIIGGALLASVSLLVFAFNHNFIIANILLALSGLGLILQVANVNTTVQTLAPDHMRGRIMSVYLTMFVGIMPLGSIFAGALAEKTSSLFVIGLGATVLLGFSSFLYFRGLIK